MNRGAADFLTKPIDFERPRDHRRQDRLAAGGAAAGGARARPAAARCATSSDIAASIQQSILPRVFPPFPERADFDLYAAMIPAREVGGDFYDFFLIDADRLGLLVADVSGKGVPAALFMAVSRTLLKATALEGLPPGECLRTGEQAPLSRQRLGDVRHRLLRGPRHAHGRRRVQQRRPQPAVRAAPRRRGRDARAHRRHGPRRDRSGVPTTPRARASSRATRCSSTPTA